MCISNNTGLYIDIFVGFLFSKESVTCLAYCVQSNRSHILKMSDRDFAHHQNLDEDDLVEDCAPFGCPTEYLKKSAHHFSSDKCDSVFDSGVDLRSVESSYSSFAGSLPVVAEKRSDTKTIEEGLEGLTLGSQKYTFTEESKCSLDDGYISYDIKECDVSHDPTRQISPEVFQLYSQDNDGDS